MGPRPTRSRGDFFHWGDIARSATEKPSHPSAIAMLLPPSEVCLERPPSLMVLASTASSILRRPVIMETEHQASVRTRPYFGLARRSSTLRRSPAGIGSVEFECRTLRTCNGEPLGAVLAAPSPTPIAVTRYRSTAFTATSSMPSRIATVTWAPPSLHEHQPRSRSLLWYTIRRAL